MEREAKVANVSSEGRISLVMPPHSNCANRVLELWDKCGPDEQVELSVSKTTGEVTDVCIINKKTGEVRY